MKKKVLNCIKPMVILIIFTVSIISTVHFSNSNEELNMINLAYINSFARADTENPGQVNCTGPSCNKYYNTRYENGLRVECCGKFDSQTTGSKQAN